MKKNYDDIIDLPRHVSDHHKPMSIMERAAQFSPFAALTGYEQQIEETARRVDEKLPLDEQRLDMINKQLMKISTMIREHPQIRLTYFVADQRKSGGKYITETLRVRQVNQSEQKLTFYDHESIVFADVYDISIEKEKKADSES